MLSQHQLNNDKGGPQAQGACTDYLLSRHIEGGMVRCTGRGIERTY
jgi:hypothetical protein